MTLRRCLGCGKEFGTPLLLRDHAPSCADQSVTVVISSSASRLPAEEQAAHTLQVLRSISACPPLTHARKILVFDALPTPAEASQLNEDDATKWREAWGRPEEYRRYVQILDREHAAGGVCWAGVERLKLDKHAHLAGTVRAALDMVDTPLVLISQHDLVILWEELHTVWEGVHTALCQGIANYVLLDRDSHNTVRPSSYFHFESSLDRQVSECKLTAVVGYSDQTHFARTEWCRAVLGRIPSDRKTCMEHVLHAQMREQWAAGGEHERSFVCGHMDDLPMVRDLVHGQVGPGDEWVYPPHRDSEWSRFYVDENSDVYHGDTGAILKAMHSSLPHG